MIVRLHSAVMDGLDVRPVAVEVEVRVGLPSFTIVGARDPTNHAVHQRLRSAIESQGYRVPQRRITVNVAPSSIHERVPALDLPIALGILAASEQIPIDGLDRILTLGGLTPGGALAHVRGAFPIAETAARDDRAIVLPPDQHREVTAVRGLQVLEAHTLKRVIGVLANPPAATASKPSLRRSPSTAPTMEDVRGHVRAKAELAAAVATGKSPLLVGPTGAGKTALARSVASLLPPMTDAEQETLTRIHSAAGLHDCDGLIVDRPFRIPHHGTSEPGLLGSIARPGEVTLAHHGVVYLDDVTAIRPGLVGAVRKVLRDRAVTVYGKSWVRRMPADAVLIGGTTGCLCGHAFTSLCRCTPQDHDRYARKIDAVRGLFDTEILVLPEPPTT